MIKYAVKSLRDRMGLAPIKCDSSPGPYPAQERGRHDEKRCARCRQLGRSCV